MSIERTRESLHRYWDSQHQDLSMMAEDVVFTHMATGDEHEGPDAVRRMLDYIYHHAFDARLEERSRIVTDKQAVIEGHFVGTHIGEFAGIPATGRPVRVPLCVVYDLEDGMIKRARVYMEMPVMMQQLGRAAAVGATVGA